MQSQSILSIEEVVVQITNVMRLTFVTMPITLATQYRNRDAIHSLRPGPFEIACDGGAGIGTIRICPLLRVI